MSNYSNNPDTTQENKSFSSRNIITGFILLIVGVALLVKKMGIPVPGWLFSWQMFLIAIGIFIGARSNFKDGGWMIPIFIGGFFLLNDYVLFGNLQRYIWPIVLIGAGVFFIARSGKKKQSNTKLNVDNNYSHNTTYSPSGIESSGNNAYSQKDKIEMNAIFSGNKKIVLSKNFMGGEINSVFGGNEIDLTQAELGGDAILEISAIFGGVSLIVPADWDIRTAETTTLFGSITDKRKMHIPVQPSGRSLTIQGTAFCGGVEIKSY